MGWGFPVLQGRFCFLSWCTEERPTWVILRHLLEKQAWSPVRGRWEGSRVESALTRADFITFLVSQPGALLSDCV